MQYKDKYNDWLSSSVINEEMKNELRSIIDEKEIEDRFYKDLEFGTGGLRGVIGAGSNRMNIYTVSKATQGFANYLNENLYETFFLYLIYHYSLFLSMADSSLRTAKGSL